MTNYAPKTSHTLVALQEDRPGKTKPARVARNCMNGKQKVALSGVLALALYARREVREIGAGIQSGCAFNRSRIGDRSWVTHRFVFLIPRFCRPDGDPLGFAGLAEPSACLPARSAISWVRIGTPVAPP
jgi:hypothetical protein